MHGHLTYLTFELAWALPVLALQWAVGSRELWRRRCTLLLAVTIPTAYLSAADGVAIANGIWSLHAHRIVGLKVVDVPIEEVLFFLLTNTMVTQTVLLFAGWRRRAQQKSARSTR